MIGSTKSAGTKTADARVLRNAPMYFRFPKKLISPGVASASDAAPVICSDESPTSSPPERATMSRTVKVTGSLPARLTLFDERLHAFESCFVHHIARHRLTRRFVRGRGAQFDLFVKKFFADRDCGSWFTENDCYEFLNFSVELLGCCDAIDEPPHLRLIGADEFAGHKHLERLFPQHIARQRHTG